MKQKIQKILIKPKTVITITTFIAIVIAITFSVMHKKSLTELFANINTTTATTENNIVSKQNLTLAFPIGGRIKSVNVKIGDTVKTGTILASLDSENALGAVNQANATYLSAQTAYEKLVNGASSPDIDIAKVALNNAKNSFNNIVSQQKVVVVNAQSTMLNSGLSAIPNTNSISTVESPTISGTYTGTSEGAYNITIYGTGNGNYFSFSGLENGNGQVSSTPMPLGTHGLYIQFPANYSISNTWKVSIPNTQASTYLANQNAYHIALQNQSQAITNAQGVIDSAEAQLNQKLAGARIEDLAIAKAQIESTKGALQIAQGTYNNTLITAPTDGTITNVTITAGQIATPNTPAIELLAK